MALIKCPNCGEQVSDKAEKCVHCGTELTPVSGGIYCPECGTAMEVDTDVCPNCGFVLKKRKKSKKKMIIAVLLIVAAVAAAATVIGVQKHKEQVALRQEEEAREKAEKEKAEKEKEEKEKAEREKAEKEALEKYSENLSLAYYSMLQGAADAESCGNLIVSVWQNAIYEEKDDQTDKYTRPDGYFVEDFNDALNNLYLDKKYSRKISKIEENQDTVVLIMKDLKDPPDEYASTYEGIKELYEKYISLTNMVINPQGSLNTFSADFHDADAEFSNCYDKMKVEIDD